MAGASNPTTVYTKQQRLAELAQQSPQMGFTSLAYHIDLKWLYEAYQCTRADAAVGVDGQTGEDFAANLRDNLQTLLDQAKSGSYRAPPVRRVRIPKGTGAETRPIGIPTLADKVLQRAVVMVLEPIYEQDFLDCSYGFRPGRSAHQALQSLWEQLMISGGSWVLEVDIRKFFDTLDHAHLKELVHQRIQDGVLRRLISKWLHAGVLENGSVTYPEQGTPQGGVISPLLANIYLHYVLDEWFEKQVKPCLRGRAFLIRYADDFVMGFACEQDARRVQEVLPKRLAKYGLPIHPDKTRLLQFVKPAGHRPGGSALTDSSGPSFDFLGFRHFWSRAKKSGKWVVKRKTAPDRLSRALHGISQWCKANRHQPIVDQHQSLSQKIRGHFGYYGKVIGNTQMLQRFVYEVTRIWKKWLSRRRRRGPGNWKWINAILKQFRWPAVPLWVPPVCSEAMT